jgi:hypothetical protein
VADTDSDGDGTADCIDNCPNDINKTEPGDCGCNVADTDSDADGVADCNDPCPNDPNDTCNCTAGDQDNDGVCDDVDNCVGTYNPDQADTDGDGIGDICDSDTLICETGFAKSTVNSTCFNDYGFNNWGWTNYINSTGTYDLNLHIGAAQCQDSEENKVGNVVVEYYNGEVVATYNVISGYEINATHLYIGCTPYPMKGNKGTVAPGQYTFKKDGLNNINSYTIGPIDVNELTDGFYVIAHAKICEASCIKCTQMGSYSPRKNTVTCNNINDKTSQSSLYGARLELYPNPASDYIILDIVNMETQNAKVTIYNSYGIMLSQKFIGNNRKVKLDVNNLTQDGLYFIMVEDNSTRLGKPVVIKKE